MGKNRIGYLIFLGIGVYLVVLYDEYVSVVSLYLLLAIPFVSGLALLFLRWKMKVNLDVSQEVVKIGEDTRIILTVENKSFLPVLHGKAKIQYKHQLDTKYEKKWLSFQVDGKQKQKITLTFSCPHCGLIEMGCIKLRIYDYLGIFSMSVPVKKKTTAIVIPELKPQESKMEQASKKEMEKISLDDYGSDNTEIKELREYRQGDSLKRIHWKLSSKKKKLMVKEYSEEQGDKEIYTFSMLYDTETPDYKWYDKKLEKLVNTSISLLVERRIHEIVWYRPTEQYFEVAKIEKIEDLGQMIESIIYAGIGQKEPGYEMASEQYMKYEMEERSA